ncbi:uncharacterized protein LOC126748940 [Anthonomus grandis grandis]|uniref:uncharacterized protein LOC126748940 n=1 Tax=Anthonomus grandis grandis TaxID=2921223 RepID=UPI0021664F5D|nr:uncharacterized protein LOC126748940 [Anthonomus grandis grandis]
MMLIGLLVWGIILSLVHGLPGAKYRSPGEVVKNQIQPEPTCEELKAMWRFSKRQSRAAELTNELPMYPDPFAENIWTPFFAASRSIAGRRFPIAFGKVAYGPNALRSGKINPEHLMSYLHYEAQLAPRRRPGSFRLPGGGHTVHGFFPPSQVGQFNHLKELIKTERARELQQQRIVEEAAAKAAAMKEVERNLPGRYTADHFSYDVSEPQEIMYSSDMPDIHQETGLQEERNHGSSDGVIAFPDLLAPVARVSPEGQVARFVSEHMPYARTHGGGRMRSHAPSLFETTAFRDGYSDYIL